MASQVASGVAWDTEHVFSSPVVRLFILVLGMSGARQTKTSTFSLYGASSFKAFYVHFLPGEVRWPRDIG